MMTEVALFDAVNPCPDSSNCCRITNFLKPYFWPPRSRTRFLRKIKSLKQQQKSVTQSNKNTECGVLIEEKEFTFQVNDQIICFE